MNALLMGMHPTFETLSAHADRPDVEGARTRTGRHVARCAQCRAVVDEVRGMGDAARAIEGEGAPPALWNRIATATASDAGRAESDTNPARPTPPPDGDVWRSTPALRPTRHMPSMPRSWVARAAVIAMAAAVIGVALLLPSSRNSLLASAPARLTVYPARPAPGSTVTVRYAIDPAMGTASRLTLLATFTPPADSVEEGYWWSGMQDSIGTLERRADGSYVGRVTLLPTFLAATLLVVPTGESPNWQRAGRKWWEASSAFQTRSLMLVAGTPSGAPSLPALLSALRGRNFLESRIGGQAADTLRKYFPDHPAGYAAAERRERRGVLDDLVHFFRSEERDYARLDGLLSAQKSVDADRLLWMAAFARKIEEPAMAAKWIRRLVKEHPDNPRTLGEYAEMVHDVELREPPADTVRRYLPMFDSLYERSGGRSRSNFQVAYTVKQYGDRAMYDRWVMRSLRGAAGNYFGVALDDESLARPDVRALAEPRLRKIANNTCVLPPGRYPVLFSTAVWWSQCQGTRAQAYGLLSRLALLSGNPRQAVAEADSSITVYALQQNCWRNTGQRRRAEALFALGDQAGAAVPYSRSYAWDDARADHVRDSVGRSLRPAVDSARWSALVADARAEFQGCKVEMSKRRKAEQAATDSARR